MSSKRRRIFLVEDHPVMQQAYKRMIGAQTDLEVCGTAVTATAALQAFDGLQPDIVVLDLSLKDMDGFDLAKELLQRRPTLCVLVVSGHESAVLAEEALRVGAKAYLPKRRIHQFIQTLRQHCCA